MKSIYLIASIVFALLIVIFIFLHLEYNPIIFDKKIHEKSIMLLKNNKNTFNNFIKSKKKVKPLSSKLWTENLFDPLRGNLNNIGTESITEPNDMELIGICSTDDLKGAIILIKKSNSRISSKYLKKKNNAKTNALVSQKKRFFKVEERLPNGYTLKEVKPEFVLLSKGNEQVLLKLKFDDPSSTSRSSATNSKILRNKLKNINRSRIKTPFNKKSPLKSNFSLKSNLNNKISQPVPVHNSR